MTVQVPPAATEPLAAQVPPLIEAPTALLPVNCRPKLVMVCAVLLGLVNVQVVPDSVDVKTTADAAFTVRVAPPVAVVPAALRAVTVQLAVPLAVVPTLMLPLVPEPEAVAPAPEQLTLALVAFAVVQLNVLLLPAATEVELKAAALTLGASTTFTVA